MDAPSARLGGSPAVQGFPLSHQGRQRGEASCKRKRSTGFRRKPGVSRLSGDGRQYHRANAGGGGAVRRKGTGPGHASFHRRRGDHHGRQRGRRIPESDRGNADRLDQRRGAGAGPRHGVPHHRGGQPGTGAGSRRSLPRRREDRRVGESLGVDRSQRTGICDRGHGGADPQQQGAGARRRPGVSRRQRDAANGAPDGARRRSRPAHRTDQQARVRETAGAHGDECETARLVSRALLSRPGPVQAGQRYRRSRGGRRAVEAGARIAGRQVSGAGHTRQTGRRRIRSAARQLPIAGGSRNL